MDLTKLIDHPELMNKETLYELRSLIALYPYHQTARLLMLQNLYLLHDTSFDEELRRAAIYITDRKAIFNLVEAAHYEMKKPRKEDKKAENAEKDGSRTISLIDSFLDTLPADSEEKSHKRKPTPADAAIDYVAYLLESEQDGTADDTQPQRELKGQSLINDFINKDGGRMRLRDEIEYTPQLQSPNDEKEMEEDLFTETLAQIYIKQKRYAKALQIIQRLYLEYPKKSAYFADQIRFLKKLIINNEQNN